MDQLLRYIKKNRISLLFLGAIILLAAFLRLIYLERIPNAIGGDELTYILTIKSMVLTGHDMTGTWNPWSILWFQYPYGQIQAELPYFLFAPVVGWSPFSLFTARITNAIVSIGIVILIYLITKKIGNEKTALFAGFLASINPWFIYIGRTAYEVVPAMFFFLCIFYILLVVRKWKILLVIPFIILAFYSYIATKTILMPFLFLSILFVYLFVNKKKDGIYYSIIFFISFLLTIFYFFMTLMHPNATRIGEIFTPFSPMVTQEVNILRTASIHSPFTALFINKITMYIAIIIAKVLNIFSFNYLFSTGDAFFSIWSHGLFYTLDIIFLIIGSVSLFLKQKRLFAFLWLFIAVGIIPHLIHVSNSDNFTPHITLIFPFIIMIIAIGIETVVQKIRQKSLHRISRGVVIIVYLIMLGSFLNIYFYQFPLHGNFDFNTRVISNYVMRAADNDKKINIYTPRSADIFSKYIFYANIYKPSTAGEIKHIILSHNYNYGNIHFLSCDNKEKMKSQDIVYVYDAQCGKTVHTSSHIATKTLFDGGDAFLIYHDTLCKNTTLKNYPTGITLADFSLEKEGIEKFCSTYIFQ